MDIRVKICGLKEARHVAAAVEAGAAYLGFNFFPKSPRFATPDEAAALVAEVPAGIARVGLTVDMGDAEMDALIAKVPLDMIQLHGSESPERVREVRARYGLPVIRALGIATPDDLPKLAEFGRVADTLLVDAKAPRGSAIPGGNGLPFDWRLIAGRRWPVPWMLAGGLTPGNVAEAIRLTGALQVDVASGVETAPGVKDEALTRAFVAAARG